MTSEKPTSEEAAQDLVAKAEQHLKDMHPDVHKSHEEVDADIRSHMVASA